MERDRTLQLLQVIAEQAEAALEGSHLLNARKRFADFVAYVNQDPVGQSLIRLFNQIAEADPKAWYERVVREGAPPPPHGDPLVEMAQAYRLIFALSREQIDLRYLVSCYYKGDHNEEKFLRFKEQMLYPLIGHLADLRDFLEEAVPPGTGDVDVGELAPRLLRL